jgi:hypothetical protein
VTNRASWNNNFGIGTVTDRFGCRSSGPRGFQRPGEHIAEMFRRPATKALHVPEVDSSLCWRSCYGRMFTVTPI